MSPGLQDTKYRSVMLRHFQIVPPGAHFQYQPSLCQEVPTYQVSCRYLKRFFSFWSDYIVCYVIFRWHHLVSQSGAVWCPFSIPTYLVSRSTYLPRFMQISRAVFELLIGHRLLSHFQMAPSGAAWCPFSIPNYLGSRSAYLPSFMQISQTVFELLIGRRLLRLTPYAKPNKRGTGGHN